MWLKKTWLKRQETANHWKDLLGFQRPLSCLSSALPVPQYIQQARGASTKLNIWVFFLVETEISVLRGREYLFAQIMGDVKRQREKSNVGV